MIGLLAQVISIMELFIQHRQSMEKLHDECGSLCTQLKYLLASSHQTRVPSPTSTSLNVASSLEIIFKLIDLNSPVLGPTMDDVGMKVYPPG
jgi:hypothetical protein